MISNLPSAASNSCRRPNMSLPTKAMTALPCASGCSSAALSPSSRHDETASSSLQYDEVFYRQRNIIERTINRIKDWRRIATRYDRHASVYLASLFIVATVTWWL